MKATHSKAAHRRGFTLMELMVAMAITTIIVAVLVNVTGTAVDTWSRGRSELRAARQAKAMADVLANDLESLVTRSGGNTEWLAAVSDVPDNSGSTNAALLVFFTAATDRYSGRIGTSQDKGGDISCAGYQLQWKDPMSLNQASQRETLVLKRMLVDPDITFSDLLGKAGPTPLETLFLNQLSPTNSNNDPLDLDENLYFVCENILQFTVTFHVEYYREEPANSGIMVRENKLVSIVPSGGGGTDSVQEFRIKGSGVVTDPQDLDIANGRVTAVDVSLSVVTDNGVESLRKDPTLASSTETKGINWRAKNIYHYSRLIQLPRM